MRVLSVANVENVAGGMGGSHTLPNSGSSDRCRVIVGGLATAGMDIGLGITAGFIATEFAPEATVAALASGKVVSPSVIASGALTIFTDLTGITGELGTAFANSVCPGTFSSWASGNAGVMATTGLTEDDLIHAF